MVSTAFAYFHFIALFIAVFMDVFEISIEGVFDALRGPFFIGIDIDDPAV